MGGICGLDLADDPERGLAVIAVINAQYAILHRGPQPDLTRRVGLPICNVILAGHHSSPMAGFDVHPHHIGRIGVRPVGGDQDVVGILRQHVDNAILAEIDGAFSARFHQRDAVMSVQIDRQQAAFRAQLRPGRLALGIDIHDQAITVLPIERANLIVARTNSMVGPLDIQAVNDQTASSIDRG